MVTLLRLSESSYTTPVGGGRLRNRNAVKHVDTDTNPHAPAEAIARTLARPSPRELQPPHPGGIRGATVARLRGGRVVG